VNTADHDFPLVVDHVYIWVDQGAPPMQALQALGLQPHQHITFHEGQGSASQSVLFKNMYLELVWVEDVQELADFTAATPNASGPPERWQETGLSPFGIGLHYRTPDAPRLPIETEQFSASWMPEGSFIESVQHTSLYCPSQFILHGPLAYWDVPEAKATHLLGVHNLTALAVTMPAGAELDPLFEQLVEHGVVTLRRGPIPLMELTFDQGAQGKSFDGRPDLPLIIHY
jgi:hypothetical protein